jgi:glutathione-regulated potassium-efflux system ancillary protein KefG
VTSLRVLVLFAHPAQREASINVAMAARARGLESVTFVDLYEEYPRFDIDIDREQHRLMEHETVVLQYPTFWYSSPAILKEWQDLVLEYGFAYGPLGRRLQDKTLLVATTTGGRDVDYSRSGGNHHAYRQFLLPVEQTAKLCGMRFLPPFVLHGANHLESPAAQAHIASYPILLSALAERAIDLERAMALEALTPDALTSLIGA